MSLTNVFVLYCFMLPCARVADGATQNAGKGGDMNQDPSHAWIGDDWRQDDDIKWTALQQDGDIEWTT